MILTRLKSTRGTGMVIAFFVLMLLAVLGISFLSVSMSSLMNSKREMLRARALACAEAGADQGMKFLMEGGPSGEAPGLWRTNHPSGNGDDHSGDVFYQDTLNPGETYKVCCRTGSSSGVTSGKVVITSIGTVTEGSATISRTIKLVVNYHEENVNVWSNCIFGGVGQSGKSIGGNVIMRGSIHLLGDGEDYTDLDNDGRWDDNEPYTDVNGNGTYDLGEPYTDVDGDGHRDAREPFKDVDGDGTRDPALTVTDIAQDVSGTASVGNNYNGMLASLTGHIPACPEEYYGGELVDSLDAKLRAKNGKVNISGNATVGFPDVKINGQKETMDGVYVSDGWGGNKGSAGVYSDNGVSKAYDLGDGLVDFPIVDAVGGPYSGYPSYLAYLAATATTVVVGDLNIGPGTTLNGPDGKPLLTPDGKTVLSVDASGNMTVNGMIAVTGNITFNPSKGTLIYSGRGTLVTPNDMTVHCNLLPKNKFPVDDVLGLIAGNQITLADSSDSQLSLALAAYAQHQITINKQSQIAGTVVSSYFSMSQVPSIFQVPALSKKENQPPGLPGGDPIIIRGLDIESWQEMR